MSAPPPSATDQAAAAAESATGAEQATIAEPSAATAGSATAGSATAGSAATAAAVVTSAPSRSAAAPSLVSAAIRTWLRYLAPLTVLSAVALSPLAILALQVRPPANAAEASAVRTLGWAIVGVAWLGQLVLVGGAAAMTGPRRSQLRALSAGLFRMLGAIVPCLAAAAAIVLGSLAFVAPGIVLFVLLSLTGASPTRGLPAALRDSITVARAHLPAVILTMIGMLALDAAIGLAAYRAFAMPLGKAPTPAQFFALRSFVRAIVAGLIVLSPLPATLLATIRRRADAQHRADA